jgi:prepilin-type N-terminal cleavage/methylation domain-containing protein
MRRPSSARRGFTLIELLVVMGIIAILAAITLGVSGYAQRRAGASRAQSEIASISAALEKYKMDNGVYPATTVASAIPAAGNGYDPTITPTDARYISNAATLYMDLSGRTNFIANGTPTAPVYMNFTVNQLTTNGVGTPDYVTDPFGYPYGYICDDPATLQNGTTNVIYNKGFFDLWSTRGQSGTGSQTNADQWISNWKDY